MSNKSPNLVTLVPSLQINVWNEIQFVNLLYENKIVHVNCLE